MHGACLFLGPPRAATHSGHFSMNSLRRGEGQAGGAGVRDTQLGRRGHRGCANEGPGSWEALGLYRPTL
ncbi:hypothetical protein GOODEAATRI_012946 [Goodea atripinnis]|uniref:Uncharacterized protein n=1 Tax=Goodea atripinnis TaxID=208336 RepID=A0ABV0NVW9_9TELE